MSDNKDILYIGMCLSSGDGGPRVFRRMHRDSKLQEATYNLWRDYSGNQTVNTAAVLYAVLKAVSESGVEIRFIGVKHKMSELVWPVGENEC